jgi:hypothetical protein
MASNSLPPSLLPRYSLKSAACIFQGSRLGDSIAAKVVVVVVVAVARGVAAKAADVVTKFQEVVVKEENRVLAKAVQAVGASWRLPRSMDFQRAITRQRRMVREEEHR